MKKHTFIQRGRKLELKASGKLRLKAFGMYHNKRIKGLWVERELRSERGLRCVSYIEKSSKYRGKKETMDDRIRIEDKDKIKESDSGCSLGPIVKSKTSNFFLL